MTFVIFVDGDYYGCVNLIKYIIWININKFVYFVWMISLKKFVDLIMLNYGTFTLLSKNKNQRSKLFFDKHELFPSNNRIQSKFSTRRS